MKKLYYTFRDEKLNDLETPLIDLFIEPCIPTTSSWFSSLDFFVEKGVKGVSDMLVRWKDGVLNGQVPWDIFEKSSSKTTVKNCPGIKDLFKNTYIVKAPCDFHFYVKNQDGQSNMICNASSDELMSFEQHPDVQFKNHKSNLFDGRMNLKITLPILLDTESTYLFLQPTYHNQIPFEILNGVISPENGQELGLNINTLVQQVDQEYMIPKGTVLCYLYFHDKVKLMHRKKAKKKHFHTTFLGRRDVF